MSASSNRYDVTIVSVPATTPEGEPFAVALARSFGIPLWQAEQIAREAPKVVKRGAPEAMAQKLLGLLASLGAVATIAGDGIAEASGVPTIVGVPSLDTADIAPSPVASTAPPPPAPIPPPEPPKPKVPSLPPLALPVARPASVAPAEARVMPLSLGPPSLADERPISLNPLASAPPRPVSGPAPPDVASPGPLPPWRSPGISLPLDRGAPAPVTVQHNQRDDLVTEVVASAPRAVSHASALPFRSSPPRTMDAPRRPFAMTPGLAAVGVVVILTIAGFFGTRWYHLRGDLAMLGNVPKEESACKERYCLTGVGLDEARRGRRTLVVAWRLDCIDPNYRVFLEGLADAHPSDLEIVGVALTAPDSHDPRTAGMSREPPPDSWPPRGCSVHFDVLSPDHGYASDWLATPVTYLCDTDGTLMSVWRGAMAQPQRDRLTSWLDGKVWEEK